MGIDHTQYMIHLDGLEKCLTCSLPDCVYDLDRLDPRRQAGCAIEGSRNMTGTEVMMRLNHQRRVIAFEEINRQIKNGKHLNLKQAAKLTGLSISTLSQYVKAGYLVVDRSGQKGYNIIEVTCFEQTNFNQIG